MLWYITTQKKNNCKFTTTTISSPYPANQRRRWIPAHITVRISGNLTASNTPHGCSAHTYCLSNFLSITVFPRSLARRCLQHARTDIAKWYSVLLLMEVQEESAHRSGRSLGLRHWAKRLSASSVSGLVSSTYPSTYDHYASDRKCLFRRAIIIYICDHCSSN